MQILSSFVVEPASGTLRQLGYHEPTQGPPRSLFRRELRLRSTSQKHNPTLTNCLFRNTTNDVWRTCECCGKRDRRMKKCSGCRLVHYCDIACQRSQWKAHKECCSADAALPIGRHYIITPPRHYITADWCSRLLGMLTAAIVAVFEMSYQWQ